MVPERIWHRNSKRKPVKVYEAKEAEFPDPDQIREVERIILIESY